MRLLRVAAYRLFAGKGTPARSLKNRGVLFVLLAALLAYVLFRATPSLAGITTQQAIVLTIATVYAGVTLVYLCTAGLQYTLAEKLTVFRFMPLHQAAIRQLVWFSYLPLYVLSAACTAPVAYMLSARQVNPYELCGIIAVTLGLAVAFHTAIRIARPVPQTIVRLVSIATCLGILVIVWETLSSTGVQTLMGIAVGFLCVLAALSAIMSRWPLALAYERARVRRTHREWLSLGIVSGLIVRAARTPRYVGANVFLGLLITGLSILAWYRPFIPYDAVCVLTLLLGGTLAQEARSLGDSPPIEGILYGAVRRWIGALWLLSYVNAAFFTAIVLVVGVLWFPHGVGAGYMQAACTGMGLTMMGILAGSVIVPYRNDVLMQCLSTALYGSFGWGILQVVAGRQVGVTLTVIAILFICCHLVAYMAESLRWNLTIRRQYVFWC